MRKKVSRTNKFDEHWVNSKWRPMMGWVYIAICLFDFILFPIAWTLLQTVIRGASTVQWMPLTLQGGGLLHISFGAIVGVSTYGRTKEKLGGVGSFSTMGIVPEIMSYSNRNDNNVGYNSLPHQANPVILINGRPGPPPANQPDL